MTLDRDIRLTVDQIFHLDKIAGKRLRELSRAIGAADERRRDGLSIQHRVLDEHHKERDALLAARESFKVAREQIQHRIRASLGMEGT